MESVNVSARLTRLNDSGLFSDVLASLEQVWTLHSTLSEFPSTNSGSKECSGRRTQHGNRKCSNGQRAYCSCGTLNGRDKDCASKNHRVLLCYCFLLKPMQYHCLVHSHSYHANHLDTIPKHCHAYHINQSHWADIFQQWWFHLYFRRN